MDGDHRRDGAAAIAIADVRPVSHVSSTPGKGLALRATKAGRRGFARRQLELRNCSSGLSCSCGHRRGSPFRPCSRFRAALRGPSPQIRASILRSWSLPLLISRIADWRRNNASSSARFIMLMKVRNGCFPPIIRKQPDTLTNAYRDLHLDLSTN